VQTYSKMTKMGYYLENWCLDCLLQINACFRNLLAVIFVRYCVMKVALYRDFLRVLNQRILHLIRVSTDVEIVHVAISVIRIPISLPAIKKVQIQAPRCFQTLQAIAQDDVSPVWASQARQIKSVSARERMRALCNSAPNWRRKQGTGTQQERQ
jgi:hypothetical protein